MSDEEDLDTLVRVSRNYRLRERELVCPECGQYVELRDGRLVCTSDREGFGVCFWAGDKLVELAVR